MATKRTEFLTLDQQNFYQKNGYLVLENIISDEQQLILKSQIQKIIENTSRNEKYSLFATGLNQKKVTDDYFLDSADKIKIFLEDINGETKINKIGHALHKHNSIFSELTHNSIFRAVSHDIGVKNPLVAQSMYIFKSANIGAKVAPHQDSTFIHTTPLSCHAFWIPLEDVNTQNGCLWIIPGSHHTPLIHRFKLDKTTNKTYFDPELNNTKTNILWKKSDYVPIIVNGGSLVLLHGSIVHKSKANNSILPRDVYTFHVIDANTKWSNENWIQNKEFDKL